MLSSLISFIVPFELLEAVIFALGMFARVLTESEESQLRAMGHILPHQKAEDALYFMVCFVDTDTDSIIVTQRN